MPHTVTPPLDGISLYHGQYDYISGDSPLSFYITPVHHINISSLISTVLEDAPAPCPVTPGQLVGCQCSDFTWRRGVVRNVVDDEVSVFLVDEGETQIVRRDCLRELTTCASIPPLALRARLSRVQSAPDEIYGDHISAFKLVGAILPFFFSSSPLCTPFFITSSPIPYYSTLGGRSCALETSTSKLSLSLMEC